MAPTPYLQGDGPQISWGHDLHLSGSRDHSNPKISNHCPDNGPQIYWGHDLDLSGSRDVISQVTIRIPMGHFLLVVHRTQVSISIRFRDIWRYAYWGYDLDLSESRDVISHVTIRIPMGHFLLVVHWTKSLSQAVFEIFGPKYIEVTTSRP